MCKKWFKTIIATIAVYLTVVVFLFGVRNDINVWTMSLLILILGYIGYFFCPYTCYAQVCRKDSAPNIAVKAKPAKKKKKR
ncbi:MAG: hypothetical protein ABII01_04470 [Candidatus Woesearchaeota archaeon]